jgi:hypothetical protein
LEDSCLVSSGTPAGVPSGAPGGAKRHEIATALAALSGEDNPLTFAEGHRRSGHPPRRAQSACPGPRGYAASRGAAYATAGEDRRLGTWCCASGCSARHHAGHQPNRYVVLTQSERICISVTCPPAGHVIDLLDWTNGPFRRSAVAEAADDNDVMAAGSYGANTIEIGGTALLLTTTGGGLAVHLTRPQDPNLSGRGAVHDHYFGAAFAARVPAEARYDREALLEPRWAEATMCGRTWAVMVGGDGGSLSPWGEEPAFAPTCRHCLASMDKLFPAPRADDRLPLVADLVASLVAEHGVAEVRDVPGDQQAALRNEIRTLVRKRTGYLIQTIFTNDTLHIVCEAVHDLHADQRLHAAVAALPNLLTNDPPSAPPPPPGWLVWWDTWAVS